MKRIINTAPPVAITTKRTPLTVTLSVGVVGDGTLTQAQDTAQSFWIPNRRNKPLILEPTFSVYDPDKNEIINVSPTIEWYLNAIQEYDSVTGDGKITSQTLSADYYLQTNSIDQENNIGTGSLTGRLVVRKNVDYHTPVVIICVVSYTDNLRQQTYSAEGRVLLTSENKPEAFYRVDIETPATVKFRPLKDSSPLRTFKAFAQHGSVALPWENVVGKAIGAVSLGSLEWSYSNTVFSASLPAAALTTGGALCQGYTQDQSLSAEDTISTSDGNIRVKDASYNNATAFKKAVGGIFLFYELATKTVDMTFVEAMELITSFFWYADGVLIPTDGSFPGYVSGQGGESLVVNADFLDGVDIMVRVGMPEITDNVNGTKTIVMPTAPNCPARATRRLSWEWPHIDALPIGSGGNRVDELVATRHFSAVIRADNVDVEAAKRAEYIRLNWLTHSTDQNFSVKTDWGWGDEVVIPSASLIKTGYAQVEVIPEPYTLGAYEVLTDSNGNVITENDGSEPVWGRC